MIIENFEGKLDAAYHEVFGDKPKPYSFNVGKKLYEDNMQFDFMSENLEFTIKGSSYDELFRRALRMVKAWNGIIKKQEEPKEEK